jgi:heterodisulfide reductase subunit A
MSEGNAPCRIACPAGVDAEGYITYVAEGKFQEALDLFRQTAPLAGVLGRVCTHPCEVNCQRGQFDEAVPACSLKRFIADAEIEVGRRKAAECRVTHDEKVAVIGSGPAGLACALDLTRLGYPVTVFEASPAAGGQMRYGIPEYRLPKDVLENEIAFIQEQGVRIKTNSPVRKIEDLTRQGYRAVFLASGAWQSMKLNIPGEDARGVLYAMDLLRRVNSGENVALGEKVIVIGGGSVAIDAARVAKRVGAREVHLVCLECRDLGSMDRMLAQNREIREAEEEGVIIHPSLGIKAISTRDGKSVGLETKVCLSVRDADGSFNPTYDNLCTALNISADSIIIAIGQTAGRSVESEGLKYGPNGTVIADPLTLETGLPGVFAGGDNFSGPSDIISAIAGGKSAALSIDRHLQGRDLREGRRTPVRSLRERPNLKSVRPPTLPVSERRAFAEVAGNLDGQTAMEQAKKCLHCGVFVPSVVFKPEDPKRQIVPYDPKKALDLWQKRHPENGEVLPDVFADAEDVTQAPRQMGGRNRLVLKPGNVEELMFFTSDDE